MRRFVLVSGLCAGLIFGTAGSAGAQVTLSPTEADFGKLTVKTESAPKTFTLSNSPPAGNPGGYPANPGIRGSQFKVVSHTCPSLLALGSSCTISVVFAPFYPGRTGAEVLGNSASPTGVSADLSGEGVAASSGKGKKGKKCEKKGKKRAAAAKKKKCKGKKK